MTKTDLKINEMLKYCEEVKVYRNRICVCVFLKNFIGKESVTFRYPLKVGNNLAIHNVYKKLDELVIAYKLK